MKITKQMPTSGTVRTRKKFAFLPMFFDHGTNKEPLRTMVWFDYYIVEEHFSWGEWCYRRRYLDE